MKISLIVLNRSSTDSADRAAELVKDKLAGCGEITVERSDSFRKVSSMLATAFSNSDMVVLAIDSLNFGKIKVAVLNAMKISSHTDEEIKGLLESNYDLSDEEIAAQSSMPDNSTVFRTSDGLNSGFAVKSGEQHFLAMALDENSTREVVGSGLSLYLRSFGFISEGSDDEVSGEISMPEPASSLAANAGEAQKGENDSNSGEEEYRYYGREKSYYEKALECLEKYDKKLYFAGTDACAAIRTDCSKYNTSGRFVFTNYITERNDEAPRSYLADLSRNAIPAGCNDFGAAISNVYAGTSSATGERKYNIYVAVADHSVSRVLRFASQPGETPEQLVEAVIPVLMDMVCDKCRTYIDDTTGGKYEPADAGKKKKKKVGAFLSIGLVLVALILAFIVYALNNGIDNMKNSAGVANSAAESLKIEMDEAESVEQLNTFPEIGVPASTEEASREVTDVSSEQPAEQ